MRVIVDEEYGYRYWMWDAPDNAKEQIESKLEDPNFFAMDLPAQFPEGTWKKLEYVEFGRIMNSWMWDLYAFLHMQDDSSVRERDDVQHYAMLDKLEWEGEEY